MKIIIRAFTLLLLVCSVTSCKKQEAPKEKRDFESLMGKDLPSWSYIQTQEDKDNLQVFKKIFEKNIASFKVGAVLAAAKIPKVFHYIWLGPKEFPSASIQNVKSFIAKHPDWTVKFWTDRKRALPHPSMEVHYVEEFPFLQTKSCFYDSENYGEKSDVLRYEILFQEGGVYVDHDVLCLEAFDEMNQDFDFYCGLEMPSATVLSSSVHVTNNIIASIPGHPILKRSMDWLSEHWQEIADTYPGNDKDSLINRIAHRTFFAFAESVRLLAGKEKNDMVFPAFYFNAPDLSKALLARHEYAGMWFENETAFEKMARERLVLISKKANKILLSCVVLTALNFLGFVCLFFYLRQAKRKQKTI